MKAYKNTAADLDADCTVVLFAVAEQAPSANYVECDSSELKNSRATQLWLKAGVRYYGFL
jgi:hypothetical protein